MKNHPIFLITIALCLTFQIQAQEKMPVIHLRSGDLSVQPNISESGIRTINEVAARQTSRELVLIQFNYIPGQQEKERLRQAGITLLDYVPDNAYTATLSKQLDWRVLQRLHARAIVPLTAEQKMSPQLAAGRIPSWASKMGGTVDILVSLSRVSNTADFLAALQSHGARLLSDELQSYGILRVRATLHRLKEIAALPEVQYLEPVPHEDQPLNFESRANSRGSVLQSQLPGGRGLTGKGVTVGIGDNSDAHLHIDFGDRVINFAAVPNSYHGTHVHGTVGSAGLRTERNKGFAPAARIISQSFSNIWIYADQYVNDFGMTITNNSYGDIIGDCGYNGVYDLVSNILDQQAAIYPQLQHVFAAGNSGDLNCSPFPLGFQTVLGTYQSAKNTLVVGNAYKNFSSGIYFSSSKGPVKDGRVKPELVAAGASIISTVGTNGYGFSNGTSMASPAVAGGLALLTERYQQLNGGSKPDNALLKALACNGASDMGNPGPDYTFGFGWLNLLRSVEIMEQGHYAKGSLANGAENSFSIPVPANTAQLKVMIYWNDPAAAPLSALTLVNDLDLTVQQPGGTVSRPLILNPAPAFVETVAVEGEDHVNNIEQVVIDQPLPGNYAAKVLASRIAQQPQQEYYLVYDIIPEGLSIEFPGNGFAFTPGVKELLQWDAYGPAGTGYTIEFSADAGGSWSALATGLADSLRQFEWTVPNSPTDQALVRITRNGTSQQKISEPFVILATPTVSLSSVQCEGYIAIQWAAIPGATDYEVMRIRGNNMETVAISSSPNYTFSGLSKDSVYWVAVRARRNGKAGNRSVAVQRQPSTGTCAGSISNADLSITRIISPVSGRLNTSTALTAATNVSVEIRNLDDAAVSSYTLAYRINAGAWVQESVTLPLAGKTSSIYTFSNKANLFPIGIYQLEVAVTNTAAADPVKSNDSLAVIVKQLNNPVLDLSSPLIEDWETLPAQTVQSATTGLAGGDRYDYENSTAVGRLRSFVGSGIASSGKKALTLDADRYFVPGNTNYFSGTYNLSAYHASSEDLRLDFLFNNHGQLANSANRVWIRSNDTANWIEVYNLDLKQEDPGQYKWSGSIELSDALLSNGKDFSSSFQIRWGQWGQILTSDIASAAGYSFDDIRMYQVFNDVQMISIDTPLVSSCGLGSAVPVRVTVRNSSSAGLSNIDVRYRLDAGNWITETIPAIAGKQSLIYEFAAPADLSTLGQHLIETVVNYPTDSFRDNDTLRSRIMNSPIVNSYPYLEDFETGKGNWYSNGKKSSWEYGTPASQKIKTAASGMNAWKTRLAGNYNDKEYSYLNSPCFDLSGLSSPMLSFMIAFDLEDCGSTICDAAWVEYSEDGTNWFKLGLPAEGYNWYIKSQAVWSEQDQTRWHVATIPLPTGKSTLRIRFVMNSDPFVSREGIAIDDIHIYEADGGLYDGLSATIPTQNIGANGWQTFRIDNKKVAELNAGTQALGSTDVKLYVHEGSVRHYGKQYYHNRSITIQPGERKPADSVAVRFYFADAETDSLLDASDCSACSLPIDVTELGVSQYSDPDIAYENGSVADNIQGEWYFHQPGFVRMVPYDNGYYAEFKVKGFSEFWLNDGGPDKVSALPVKLAEFDARKTGVGDQVQLSWKVAAEDNVDRYEVELAAGYEALQQNGFVRIGQLGSLGNSTGLREYSLTDDISPKTGVRYYRLKIVNLDGSIAYSATRSVYFSNDLNWQLYPNPSSGETFLLFLAAANDRINVQLLDANGRLLQRTVLTGTGAVQKYRFDLSAAAYPAGAYLFKMEYLGKQYLFRYYKQ